MAKKKDKYRGIIGTLIFHGVLILLLIIFGFSTSLPLPGEEGVEVNLGSGTEGKGNIQPENPAVVQKSTPPPPQAAEKEDEEVVTQDVEPAPALETKKKVKTEKQPVKTEPKKEEPKVNPNALYKGKSQEAVDREGQETNEGITGKAGDQGNPNGTPDSKNYEGLGGSGNGTSFSLSGRTPKYLPEPGKNFTENGTVVVQITVDKYGKVVIAMAIDKGSNTTNSVLRRLAEEAAKKAIFNVKLDAPEMQKGTITYHFVVKN